MDRDIAGFRLFTWLGIDVYVHWTWALVALYEINTRASEYPSLVWNVAEYLSLFAIVLLHEFGHALACRQVGGQADRVMLWPLGGVAFVKPPFRPGALLWSIAAGPLVNLLLAPILFVAMMATRDHAPDGLSHFTSSMFVINLCLLIFNLVPVYPLDGGQILHALLWFVMGRGASLAVCCVIGLVGAVGIFLLAVTFSDLWLVVLAIFIGIHAWHGLWQVRAVLRTQPALDLIYKAQALLARGQPEDALEASEEALDMLHKKDPIRGDAYAQRGLAKLAMDDPNGAIADFDLSTQILAPSASLLLERARACMQVGRISSAANDFEEVLELDPDNVDALLEYAWLRATNADARVRNGTTAVKMATRACELTQWKEPACLRALAASYAELGDFEDAVKWERKAEELSPVKDDELLKRYESRQPYHQDSAPSLRRPSTPTDDHFTEVP